MKTTRNKYISATINGVRERIPEIVQATSCKGGEERFTKPSIQTDGGRQIPSRKDGQDRVMQDELDQLHLITQVTRANLIQNILGHACMMPSLKELDHYNPSKSAGTISGHLDKLIDGGIVRRMTLPQGMRNRSLPSTFYILSDVGYELLERHSLFIPDIDEIRADHARVEKTDTVKRYEQAPRPTADVEYAHPLKGDGMTIVTPSDCEDCSSWEDFDRNDPEELVIGP